MSDLQRGRPGYAERDVTDGMRYIPARVPGCVHSDLMRAGLLDDPRVGTNVLKARWVEEMIWSYRCEFDRPTEWGDGPGARAWLVFEQIDGVGEVVLNGQKLARHANSFLPLRVEVTEQLREHGNVLAVHLESGLYHVSDKPAEGWCHDNARDALLHKRHWLRKVQSQGSWDWAPRLMNVGLGLVRLEWTRAEVRVDYMAVIPRVSDELDRGHVTIRVWIENLGLCDLDVRLQMDLKDPEGHVAASCEIEVTLRPGMNRTELQIEATSPRLWWPIGQGEQCLYEVRGRMTVLSKSISERRSSDRLLPNEAESRQACGEIGFGGKRFGFRHIWIDQSEHQEGGRLFVLHVNGRAIFCRGANLVPADMLMAEVDRSRYERLVGRAIEANFNFLRVWGGGLYEHDDFYDLCDRHGILVWQDFVYACGKYPLNDEAFHAGAVEEARYQLRRLSHHPSLVMWCGNNENETAIVTGWAGMSRGQIAPDYGFYHLTLSKLCREEDGTRPYQPSSPFSPDGRHPGDELSGDQHPWSVGIDDMDFRKYRGMRCRFANEGGTLGPTSLPTMLACLPEGQRYVQSFAWQLHDNSVDSWQEPSLVDAMTRIWLGMDCRAMTIEEYVYWGGLLQAEGLRAYIDRFRGRMFDSAAAVFWMFNDCWPATRSWSIVDHALRRTPSFHPVRRAFSPVSVVFLEEGDQLLIHGVNDTQDEIRLEHRFGIVRFPGDYEVDETAEVRLRPNQATRIGVIERSKMDDPTRQIAFSMLKRRGTVVANNRWIGPMYLEVEWPEAQVRVSVSDGRARFESEVFALGVCIDLSGECEDGGVSDNLFDLFPGVPHEVPWSHPKPPTVLFVGNSMRKKRST